MSCPRCEPGGATVLAAPRPAVDTWCLVGTPNVGKTSLINAIAGSHLEVGNWTGTTVEVAVARVQLAGREVTLVDLPGAYALAGTSPEEDVVLQALMADPDALIVDVLDATHLARDLTLTLELTELARPMVVALNLVEQAVARGIVVDPAALEARLGVPVVALPDHRRVGAAALVDAVAQARTPVPLVTYPDAVTTAVARLTPRAASRWHALAALTDELPRGTVVVGANDARAELDAAAVDPFLSVAEARFRTAHDVATAATTRSIHRQDPSERIDRWLLHPWLGPVALVAGLALTFHLTFALANPWVDFFGSVQAVLVGWIAALALPPLLASFLGDALVAGVGTVVAFVPVLFVLYVLLGMLENAGILARVAYLADGLMRAIGLPGRAVLPMVLSIGCTVPAIQATRTLEERGDRLRVALAIPSISCSARLPVFVLLAGAFVPAYAAVVVTGLYLLGFVVAILSALAFRHLLRTDEGSGAMELPSYRWPPAKLVWALAWARTRSFLRSAGGPILIAVVAVWALLSVQLPNGGSLFETVARFLAPAFAPLGMDDWRVVGALIPGAVAKEVVIGSLALTLTGGAPVEALGWFEGVRQITAAFVGAFGDVLTSLWGLGGGNEIDGALGARLGGVLTTGGALALMVFTLLYMPCVATLAALRSAFGTRWMLFSIGYQTVVAYAAAWAVFALWP